MSFLSRTIKSMFNQQADDQRPQIQLPETDFAAYLSEKFGRETAVNVLSSFDKMGLPAPKGKEEFLDGTEGGLMFLNKYGVTIRIEKTDTHSGGYTVDRINDNGWILSPLGTITAGKATIEICPGCHLEKDESKDKYLHTELRKDDISYFDRGIRNVGRLPFKTPSFPEGVPVILDRLAVRKLTTGLSGVKEALKSKEVMEAEQAQEALYGPLKKSFETSWPQPEKMKEFWKLCQKNVAEGKLVAGWNEYKSLSSFIDDNEKSGQVTRIARSYENAAAKVEMNKPSVAVQRKSSMQLS